MGMNKYIDTQHHEGVSETYFKKETAQNTTYCMIQSMQCSQTGTTHQPMESEVRPMVILSCSEEARGRFPRCGDIKFLELDAFFMSIFAP